MKRIKVILALIISISLSGTLVTIAQLPTYNAIEYLKPFWATDTMYNESVMMVSLDSCSLAESTLLFAPIKIISVKNASLTISYKENVDWVFRHGKLILLPGSKAVFMTQNQLYPVTPRSNYPKVGGGYILHRESHFFHDMQLSVTYTHSKDAWKGPVPHYSDANLPQTTRKLVLGEPLKIVSYGNSITAGYNASGYTGVPPYMPAYAELVANKLRSNYKSTITLENSAVAGKDAAWGLVHVDSLLIMKKPDLVILSFGMNDGTAGVAPEIFKNRIKAIIDKVRANCPATEFILVATILANPETFYSGQQENYKPVLQKLVGPGTQLVDMTGVHRELLKHKMFRDITGNNINHPNDFLHRWYAQQICGLLIP